MLHTNLKLVLREFLKGRTVSFFIITGMVLGITSFLLIYQVVVNELSFDRFHQNSDRIYRVICDVRFGSSIINAPATPPPLAQVMNEEYPEVEKSTRIVEKKFFVGKKRALSMNSVLRLWIRIFFQFFGFKLNTKHPETLLKTPTSIVMTEEMALKYFDEKNPVGKNLVIREIDAKSIYRYRDSKKYTKKTQALNTTFLYPFPLTLIMTREDGIF
ncbi:MAG: ABC transporter permease [Bacteroidales bacterium]|nr:ABC transporter permease [Bacteroidales bacterium]